MSDVKPCPFCGLRDYTEDDSIRECRECGAMWPDSRLRWESRPCEDAAHAMHLRVDEILNADREKRIGELAAERDAAVEEAASLCRKLDLANEIICYSETREAAAVEEARRLADLAMEARAIIETAVLQIEDDDVAEMCDAWLARWPGVKP